jgi:hypothetical protein
MPPATDDDGAEAPAERTDLFADLFFGMGAIFLLAVVLIAPTLGIATSREHAARSDIAERLAAATITVGGRAAASILTGPDGLLVPGSERRIPTDTIPDDPDLRRFLARVRAGSESLVLIVEPAGEEAAFALEPILAAEGPARLRQVRIDRDCTGVTASVRARVCAGTGLPR